MVTPVLVPGIYAKKYRRFQIDQVRPAFYTRRVKVKASGASRSKRHSEPEQLALWKKRGGKRRGAGRPPKGPRAGSPHTERPFLHPRYPVHVTLRVIGEVGNLRRRRVYQAIREATLTTARREDCRVAPAVADRGPPRSGQGDFHHPALLSARLTECSRSAL